MLTVTIQSSFPSLIWNISEANFNLSILSATLQYYFFTPDYYPHLA
jgi:hypothetical protein